MKHNTLLKERADTESRDFASSTTSSRQITPVTRFIHSCQRMLLDGRGIIAYLPIVVALLLLLYGASWQMFTLRADTAHYQCYALAFWQGSKGLSFLPANQCTFFATFGVPQNTIEPLHILPLEYPPLTLILFSPILAAPLHYYPIAFALLMAIVALFIYWLLLRYGPRGAALACAAYLVIGAWSTAEARFDLVPAALTLLCLIAAERRRWTLAYVALAFGFLFKIYPLLLLPALFMAEQIARQRFSQPPESLRYQDWPGAIWQTLRGINQWYWKNLLLFCGLSLVIGGGFALINFQGAVVSQLSYFANRPIQVESTGSTILWLASHLGHPAQVVRSFGSTNIVSNLGHRVALIEEMCLFLGYALAILWQWRGRFHLTQTCIAILLGFIVTGKVFSPQYLIWLIPLLAYNGSFKRAWLVLWTSLSIVTTIIFPYMYQIAGGKDSAFVAPGFVTLVALRNLLLILATLAFFFNWWHIHRQKTPTRPEHQTLRPDAR